MKKAASMQAMLLGISQGLWEFLPKTTSLFYKRNVKGNLYKKQDNLGIKPKNLRVLHEFIPKEIWEFSMLEYCNSKQGENTVGQEE